MAAADPRPVATLAEARALAHPIRLRIIRLTYDADLTNEEIAQRLGRDPATVLHHVRTLVDTGFLRRLEPRRGPRGSRERPYRSTGKSFRLNTNPTGVDISGAALEAFAEEIAATDPVTRDIGRLALRVSPERRAELSARFSAILREASEWEDDPAGVGTAIFLAIYDRPTG